jgi:hypothetical protein
MPQVAVGLERAHAEHVGQREGVAVVAFCPLGIRGIVLRGGLPQEPQGPCLVARFLTAFIV